MTNDIPVVERSFKVLWMWITVGILWVLVIVGSILWWKLPSWAPGFVVHYILIPDIVMRTAIEGDVSSRDVSDRLVEIGPRSVSTARSYLHRTEKKYRLISIDVIAKLKPADCYDDIIALLKDSDDEVVNAAIVALGNIGDNRAIEPLLKIIDKKGLNLLAYNAVIKLPHNLVADACKPYVAEKEEFSLYVLGEIADARVPEWLDKEMRITEADSKKTMETFLTWNETAALALASTKSPNARAFIEKALTDPDPIVRKRMLRGVALNAGQKKDPKLDKLIILNLAHDETDIIMSAATVCNILGITDAVPLLLELMNNADAKKRKAGIYGFGLNLIDPQATQRLIELINDQEKDVRYAAISVIGRMAVNVNGGDETLLEPLLQALNDQQTQIKKSALVYLSRFKKSSRINDAVLPLLNDSITEVTDSAFELIDAELLTTEQKMIYDEFLKSKESQE